MMTSSRPREFGGSFASRRGHSNKLSISDPSHHVTEAIGTLYDDEDEYSPQDHHTPLQRVPENHRPLSFVPSQQQEQFARSRGSDMAGGSDDTRRPLVRSASDMTGQQSSNGNPPMKKAQTVPARMPSKRNNSYEGNPASPLSPSVSLKDMQADEAASQFPLTNIDNPNDIAQELSNLQALRRMSMDVGNNSSLDPDMLPYSGMSLMPMPSIAPTGGDDEADPSRLLWVPARVHPELAPTEFKSFLENRVQSIKRRSGDSFLSADGGLDRTGSSGSNTGGGLRRKKSMLSRQVDPTDGAERLERQRSQGGLSPTPELSLDELAKDPTQAIRKLTLDSQRQEPGSDAGEDMPILPVAPGMGLRRSTRTTYRKGGSLRGERLPFSKRVAARNAEAESQDNANARKPSLEAPSGHGLSRVQSEPVTENYSRPTRSVRRQQKFSQDSVTSVKSNEDEFADSGSPSAPRPQQDHLPVRSSSVDASNAPVPQIIEPSIQDDDDDHQGRGSQAARPYPERSSSQKAGQQMVSTSQPQDQHRRYQQLQHQQQHEQVPDEPPARSNRRPVPNRSAATSPPPPGQQQQQPTPKPAHEATSHGPTIPPDSRVNRTDSLTFIPTYTPSEEKKDKRGKRDRDDDTSSISSTKSSGWKWFKGSTDDKKKKEEESKRGKGKGIVERAQDNVRLDVLQTSIENAVTKGRESLLLDRDSIDNKLHEERKKESNRKSDGKKEKDGNILSFLGIGGKKKSDKDGEKKKGHHLRVSEDHHHVYRPLRPDIDYHWTRFPLLEERAIYRMAHIKLANPRRSLHSQVLLSNFMYNYLAIVQAMHPQMQVPISPQQKRLAEEERKRKEAEQKAYLAEQQMQQQAQQQESIDRYGYDYHGDGNHGHYGDGQSDDVEYVDDAQIYEYDHGDQDDYQDRHDGYGQHGQQKDYYGYGQQHNDDGRGHHGGGGRDDMW